MKEREYIVTLHRYEDLNSFYEDMENLGGNLYIPNRKVDVCNRRPMSRNTHYLLTDSEAQTLRNDPRVLSVELTPKDLGISISRSWTQQSNFWSKGTAVNSLHVNWGLLRSIEGEQRPNWGSDGTITVSGTVKTSSSGRNVDVVIVDGAINPNHPEFAVNPDGTGGSRVNQFNWFSLNPEVIGQASTTYNYAPYVDNSNPGKTADNDHGAHVAGIACGNTQGWARDANIFNINPYASATSPTDFFIDYIRAWHKTKPINPLTGRRNPTITNHSYGTVAEMPISDITSIRYRGVTVQGPFTAPQLKNFGIYTSSPTTVEITIRYLPYEQDLLDAINDGIIVIGAAGNNSAKINNFSTSISDDYNNYLIKSGNTTYFYMRGGFSSAGAVICVGAVGTLINQTKATYSNCGPRIDVYAPGSSIISAINSTVGTNAQDLRNNSFRFAKKSGTSMAAPQVTGIVACLAEQRQRLNQNDAKEYITNIAKNGQLGTTNGGAGDNTDLQGSPNKYLYYQNEREEQGQMYPPAKEGIRPVRGMMFPRSKIYRYGT